MLERVDHPSGLPAIIVRGAKEARVVDCLVALGLVKSLGEAKRAIKQGAVKVGPYERI